jgi:lysophospholipase L1-like esterase
MDISQNMIPVQSAMQFFQQSQSIRQVVQRLQPEERIVFVGDSITYFGGKSGGYVDRFEKALRQELRHQNPKHNITIQHYGLGGAQVPDLWVGKTEWTETAPYEDILIADRPTILVIYIGVNDAWHEVKTPLDVYRSGIAKLIQQGQDMGATVILATPAVIGEKADDSNPNDALLDEFSQISQTVGASKQVIVCNLRQGFKDYLQQHNLNHKTQGILTSDGVHMNAKGNKLITELLTQSIAQALAQRHEAAIKF